MVIARYALNTAMSPRSREPLDLAQEQSINETAHSRAIEICVEDHPKMVTPASLAWARTLGITALEMGVQTTNDVVHALTKRDSTRHQLIRRARLTKEFGLKTLAHIMPDLPGSDPAVDKAVVDDITGGSGFVRARDFRCLAAPLSAAVSVMVFATTGWPRGGHALLCAVICAAASACAVLALDACCALERHFLFDYDRFKLYPTMVLEFSELKKWYAAGKYVPYFERHGADALFDVVQYFMEHVKPHQRIERIIRDVPAAKQKSRPNYVVGGVNVTNANQIVQKRMETRGLRCKCLRSREIRDHYSDVSSAVLHEFHYHANGGNEWFFSFETPDRRFVYGFVKMRINNCRDYGHLPREIRGCDVALIRWLQVYGRAIPIGGGRKERSSQHMGFGKRLMAHAEDVARRHGCTRLADISGIGVRPYYRNLGYTLDGTYMIKNIRGY